MKKSLKILIAAGAAAVILVTAAIAGWILYRQDSLVTVDGIEYHSQGGVLDLRGQEVSAEHFENLRKAMPDTKILWDVPFQRRHYASNTEKITITSLGTEDVEMLSYLENLSFVDASNCFDYEALALLRKTLPDCRIESYVAVEEQILPWNAEQLLFSSGCGDFEELMEKLSYLPNMKTVFFEKTELSAEQLNLLREAYPQIAFSWTIELFGKLMSSQETDLDISGMKFESTAEIEAQTDYLPNLRKLTMCDTGLPYEEIAAFRERSRERFQVIFNVIIKNLDVRTDIRRFVPWELGVVVSDCDTRHLVYCEDLVYVDMSHCMVRNIDWARGTPHLQYLIIKDSPFRDIQPLRYLKELKLLELSKLDLRDVRPLLDCTALEDLKITGVFPNIEVLGQMTWLKNLWVTGGKDELQSLLPDTTVHADYEAGWEKLTNYREMMALTDPVVPEILENPPKKKIVPGFVIPKM